ncbi:glycosyltransferase [Vibrio sp. 404]|uniref:Glycosyltransferase n=1 Tax=Vibrio marinisediminis TaxID=2758441 RepID=A0A7W2IU89_9VIBR|nr:glycosyltransferase [Vibrio marinisediminis]MBA5762817.1 glycosyltransferase [Vibrio marinisediminis]
MKVSLIIAVYKDFKALELILEQACNQTYQNFEVIIAEDAISEEVPLLITQFAQLKIKHCSQDDFGIRKMRSQNNAILAAEGDYLVFIDGDCIPYPTFLEAHASMAKAGYVSSGRRVNLGPKVSAEIREKFLDSKKLANNYLSYFFKVLSDGKEGHAESGFTFKPNGFIHRNLLTNIKRTTSLLGCNFGCFKKDIMSINGFDESYGETAIGDDTDIEWRFRAYGLQLQSVKNIANVFHLYHEKRSRVIPEEAELLIEMKERRDEGLFIARVGLDERD